MKFPDLAGQLAQRAVASIPLSKEDFAYETLRDAILSGDLVAGEVLVQTEIARILRISAIPVRAAVGRLIAEGLVTQERHRPPQVSKLATEELAEILVVRSHLETLATKVAVPRITPAQLATLRELVHDLEVALRDNDMSQYGALNKRFHLAIYDACPYRLLVQMIKDLWDNTDRHRSRAMFSMVPHLAEQSQVDHRRLLGLIENGAAEEAARLTDEHKTRALQLFMAVL